MDAKTHKSAPISSEELKRLQLSIMDDIHSFCVHNHISYSLTGGTLIGAIRHKGYIPWDDDIDIMMPRPDYERFLKEFHSDKYVVINLMNSDLCVETFTKICLKDTLMVDRELGRGIWGINVDLFPIDGFPEDGRREHFDQLESLNNKLGVYCPFYRSVSKNRMAWFVKYLAKRILHFYPHSFLHLKQELLSLLLTHQFETSPYASLYCGGDGWREIMPKSVFSSFINGQFEGRAYLIISSFDTYLTNVFGDYMQLPPEEERIPKHNYDSYILS